ncbi:MAG: dihydroorotate dehydrogenase-like protein [Thermoanaerobaculaceae bacterium]|nr:dihydroorotate dehydrogenase-like protein [Thermoanaerobaculaceae bacterium]MDI9622205.1 dihydroorotate dehydrogenase-like protein [Acidobacteriota bacterium]NLH12602.1 dihydroorotate dehydrogenase-like protein [Holophagae bacterium]HPW54928.1 dihydroorotate dehydrogenase-like protein [Thermoanaerobaculaceae bacterium]
MDLSTSYLGLKLANPLLVGSSPLVDEMDTVQRLAEAGIGGIVMHSIFEEQITREQLGTIMDMELHAESFAEALSYFPHPEEYRLGPEKYLEQIRKVKETTGLPVIGSLNGVTPAGWLDYAKQVEQAGADALELNVYYLPTQVWETGDEVEKRTLDIVKTVRAAVKLPLAVKLSPFFSSIPNLAQRLETAGAGALVIFNRFFQPDIDIEALEPKVHLELSTSDELLLRLRWLAILHGQIKCDLAVTGGVHTAHDAIKALMAGASAVQLVSVLLAKGPEQVKVIRDVMRTWFEEHEYESMEQVIGSMSLQRSPNSQTFTRANYQRLLAGWRP